MADNITITQPDLINRLLDNLPSGYNINDVRTPNDNNNTISNGKWLRVSVVPFETQSDAATGAFKLTRGLCVIDVFYPKGSGDFEQLADVQSIRELYENQSFNNTQCQEASINTIGTDGSWYNIQINVNFYMTGCSQ